MPSHTPPTPALIEIDTGNFYSSPSGLQAVDPSELAKLSGKFSEIVQSVNAGRQHGLEAEYACLDLGLTMAAQLEPIQSAASSLRQFRDVVVIGIGGSSLGTKAILQAVDPDAFARDMARLHFVENIDSYSLHRLQSRLDPATTALLCISKSGGTVETVVQYLILRDWLNQHLGEPRARRQQWVVTDPKSGWLRELATREDLAALPVPPRVGGRYSVLSTVGLLPLAATGVDLQQLLAGAADNARRCSAVTVNNNPALEMAALYYLLDTRCRKRIAVMMPYINRLQLFVDWYCQLWAESLGKWDRRQSDTTPAGTLPVRAMGAVDQHSQLQMYLESRHDKFFTFIELKQWEHNLPIPLSEFDRHHFSYLSGKTMVDVVDAEFRATRQVITDAGHPNMTIRLPALNAHVLGQLIDLYQRVTVYTGLLYGINPLDQPSVEKGKRLAIELLKIPAG